MSYRRAMIALLLAATISACSNNESADVNESLTSDASRIQSIEYLQQSVAVLPAGARLDRAHPDLPSAHLGLAAYAPCYDSNTIVDGPHHFHSAFWVVDGGDGPAGLKTLVAAWDQWGWTVEDGTHGDGTHSGGTHGDGTSARGTSPDGYRMTAKLSNTDHLSIGIASPCFPFDNGTDLDADAPAVIEQP